MTSEAHLICCLIYVQNDHETHSEVLFDDLFNHKHKFVINDLKVQSKLLLNDNDVQVYHKKQVKFVNYPENVASIV